MRAGWKEKENNEARVSAANIKFSLMEKFSAKRVYFELANLISHYVMSRLK